MVSVGVSVRCSRWPLSEQTSWRVGRGDSNTGPRVSSPLLRCKSSEPFRELRARERAFLGHHVRGRRWAQPFSTHPARRRGASATPPRGRRGLSPWLRATRSWRRAAPGIAALFFAQGAVDHDAEEGREREEAQGGGRPAARRPGSPRDV